MIIPDSAKPWIKLHRSAALGNVKSAYSRLIREDYQELEKHLPASASSILDIGCGLAGIDVLLYERYASPTLNLLDGTGNAPQATGFNVGGIKPFNDMSVARELLVANGIAPRNIKEFPVGYADPPIPCNLCISLLSWGWHFPVEAYLDLAWNSLAVGGRLILDVRAKTGGETILDTKGFRRLAVIRTTPKGWRLCLERTADARLQSFKSGVFK